jgi:hypothetical protein
MPSIFNIEVSDLPKNRMKIETKGANYRETVKIPFDDIVIPIDKTSKKTNTARQGDEDGKHIADLRYSFSEGVNVNAPPPSVEYLEQGIEVDGTFKFYRLLDGHHRLAALMDNITEYVFDVYSIVASEGERARTTLQLKSNAHNPSKKSSDNDIIASGNALLRAGKFNINGTLDVDEVAEWVAEVKGGRLKSDRNKKLVTGILNQSAVHLPYVLYADRAAVRWVKKNMPHVLLNEDGGNYWIFKKAPDRSFLRMLKKDTNNKQYIILNPEPSSAGNVISTRENLYNYIMELWKVTCEKTGGDPDDNNVFEIVYALPQLRDKENMSHPISMTKD